ncbi:MAG TPA: aspartyl/asparaginyl beta-hydroxylase domain-containing protein [Bacteroidia bacterium]|jgi:aspartyl/asparaginyl beta-hydroxylase (cupin superfamily)
MASTAYEWYSFAENGSYKGPEPCFFDIVQKEWAIILERNHSIIRDEFEKIVAARDKDLIPYFNRTLASNEKHWTIFPLHVWGKKWKENCEKCPVTSRLVESIPAMTSCTFSVLQPHTSIKPHNGDSNVMYRCHLTLKSKSGLPQMGMRVGLDTTEWVEGRIFAFCDAYEHEVWNHTENERWVLIIDVLREPYEHRKKEICAKVNATLWWQLKFQKRYIFRHFPAWSRKMLMELSSKFF